MPFTSFSEYINKRRNQAATVLQHRDQSPDDAYQLDQQQPRTVATKQYQMDETTKRYPMDEKWWIPTKLPEIDGNNVLGSLSGMLGPSPEERAEEEKRLQEHRQKMHGWTALFNGLRHLSNLYYATKGAPGQKYNDPHQLIEQQYQDERRRLAEIHAADRNYYGTLYNIRRQMEADRIAEENHQSTLEWRKAQQEDRQRQQQRQFEEKQRQFEEKQRQFDERQRQQQQQFEARQKQQQRQFEERQRSKNTTAKGGQRKVTKRRSRTSL